MPEISIVDTKNIIRTVKQKYETDLSIFSLFPLRYKLDRIIRSHHLKFTDNLIARINEDEEFFEIFMHELLNTDAELFRDPELWIQLKDTILDQLNRLFGEFNICLQAFSGCNELYSLLILLEETGFREKSNVFVSYNSEYDQSIIFNSSKVFRSRDISIDNLYKVFPNMDPNKYFTISEEKYTLKKKLLNNVFTSQNRCIIPGIDFAEAFCPPDQESNLASSESKFTIILFRNKLINFSLSAQNLLIKKLVGTLDKSGIIIFGYRENISDYLRSSKDIFAFYENENIFKKP